MKNDANIAYGSFLGKYLFITYYLFIIPPFPQKKVKASKHARHLKDRGSQRAC